MNLARFAVILVVVTPHAFSQTWEYVSVSEKGMGPGSWEAGYGKGTGGVKNSRFRIEVTYSENQAFGPAMVIQGRIAPDGRVKAVASYLATDQTDDKFSGVYLRRTWTETHGVRKVMVTSEEIVFPYPQNWLFMRLRTRTYQEAKRPD